MSKIELRLQEYLKTNKIRVSEVEDCAGMSNGSLGKHFNLESRGVSSKALDNILQCYPDINRDWLFSGDGNMSVEADLKENKHLDEYNSSYNPKFGPANFMGLFTQYPAMCITDDKHQISSVNETFSRQTGFKQKDVKGKLIEEVLFKKGKKDSELVKIDTKRNALVTFHADFTAFHASGFKLAAQTYFCPMITESSLEGYVIFANFMPSGE